MTDNFNYNPYFEYALQQIKCVRNPHSTKSEVSDLKWNVVRQHILFNFGGTDFEKYTRTISIAKEISIFCLNEIIIQLLNYYSYTYEQINIKFKKDISSEIYFLIKDINSNTLLFFKEIEECNYWKSSESEYIKTLMRQCNVSSCKYIYFVSDYAYLQIINHNEDESDPGRGHNVYSIKWFFETYFGEDEYQNFYSNLKKYVHEANSYLGYILIKSLTPNSLINFRKITENKISKFPYDLLLQKKIDNFTLTEKEFHNLKKQYIDSKAYLILLGDHDFAESLITAEWLYNSMKKATAIDLTMIGMGYFKAVEQLLFDLICLHKNENRFIRKDLSRKDLPNKDILLSEANINDEAIDTTIGSIANFYKNNLNILREELSLQTKKYICETIFSYKDLRNGYFHKNNIHSWNMIDEIRHETFFIMFLLLGAHTLTDNNRLELGIPNIDEISDYSRLCEYVNYHNGELFFLTTGHDENILAIACCDMHSKAVDSGYIKYSGAYFKIMGNENKKYLLSEDHLPNEIYLGKIVFAQTDMVNMKPVKVKKIFENGKYVGPSIVEEYGFNY